MSNQLVLCPTRVDQPLTKAKKKLAPLPAGLCTTTATTITARTSSNIITSTTSIIRFIRKITIMCAAAAQTQDYSRCLDSPLPRVCYFSVDQQHIISLFPTLACFSWNASWATRGSEAVYNCSFPWVVLWVSSFCFLLVSHLKGLWFSSSLPLPHPCQRREQLAVVGQPMEQGAAQKVIESQRVRVSGLILASVKETQWISHWYLSAKITSKCQQ